MLCKKCSHMEMHREYDRQADTGVSVCFKCGFRAYDRYPMVEEDWTKLKRHVSKYISPILDEDWIRLKLYVDTYISCEQ